MHRKPLRAQFHSLLASEPVWTVDHTSPESTDAIQLDSERFWNKAEWSFHAENCVSRWARRLHRSEKILPLEYPDVVVIGENEMYGYEVFTPTNLSRASVRNKIKKASSMRLRLPISNLSLVIVFPYDAFEELRETTIDRYSRDIAEMMFDCQLNSAVIGHVQDDEFEPVITIAEPEGSKS
jgi:hypothetical protein